MAKAMLRKSIPDLATAEIKSEQTRRYVDEHIPAGATDQPSRDRQNADHRIWEPPSWRRSRSTSAK
jgi:hypothetical protein